MVYDPFEEIRRVLRAMDRMFDELFERPYEPMPVPRRFGVITTLRNLREPYTEVVDAGDELIITAELPGMSKEDIDVTVTENTITIRAEKKEEKEERTEEGIRITRGYSGFYKEIALPVAVDPNTAKAKYNNGILEIRVKKIAAEKGKKLKIE